jgi:hypothetical protein
MRELGRARERSTPARFEKQAPKTGIVKNRLARAVPLEHDERHLIDAERTAPAAVLIMSS